MARRISSLSDSPRRQQDHYADTEDRISDLPDSILGRVLSLLPTKNALATSILSKRWKLLWTTTVNLDFCCPQNYTGAVDLFVQFVNYVLLLHKPAVYFNRLSLTWGKGCIPIYVNTWISAAVARDVHELFVCVEISKLPIQVQTYMFSSERLQSLELNCSICISPEIVVSLPRLERLKLISIYFPSEESFSDLLEGCPILKYLVIHMDIGNMIRKGDIFSFNCIISSTFLRHLELYAYDKQHPRGTVLCDVQLDAPSLRYIKLEDQIRCIFIRQRLVFLDEAIILFGAFERLSEDEKYCNSLVEAFHAFGCAKTITLSDQVIWALSCATFKMKTEFNRLTRLEVIMDRNYWSSLLDFIKLSDNLEVVVVNKRWVYFEVELNNSNWKKPDVVPRCLSNSLKTVSVGSYDGYPDQLATVDYILSHGSVLEVMQICFREPVRAFERKLKLVQEICESSRKSPICKVKFSDRDNQHNAL